MHIVVNKNFKLLGSGICHANNQSHETRQLMLEYKLFTAKRATFNPARAEPAHSNTHTHTHKNA